MRYAKGNECIRSGTVKLGPCIELLWFPPSCLVPTGTTYSGSRYRDCCRPHFAICISICSMRRAVKLVSNICGIRMPIIIPPTTNTLLCIISVIALKHPRVCIVEVLNVSDVDDFCIPLPHK